MAQWKIEKVFIVSIVLSFLSRARCAHQFSHFVVVVVRFPLEFICRCAKIEGISRALHLDALSTFQKYTNRKGEFPLKTAYMYSALMIPKGSIVISSLLLRFFFCKCVCVVSISTKKSNEYIKWRAPVLFTYFQYMFSSIHFNNMPWRYSSCECFCASDNKFNWSFYLCNVIRYEFWRKNVNFISFYTAITLHRL